MTTPYDALLSHAVKITKAQQAIRRASEEVAAQAATQSGPASPQQRQADT